MKKTINVALIGGAAGIGKLHSAAYSQLPILFTDRNFDIVKKLLVDVSDERAADAAEKYGWQESSSDWMTAVMRDDIDMVDIIVPNMLHKDIALAAINAGKLVYCEKPMALCGEEAREMWQAAEKANAKTAIGCNKRHFAAIEFAKQILDSGELGDVFLFHGNFMQNLQMDPNGGAVWYMRKDMAGWGALSDSGSHLFDMARCLCGDFEEVVGTVDTHYSKRRWGGSDGEMMDIEVPDSAMVLAKMASGAKANFEISRNASGELNNLSFELWCSKGAIKWSEKHANELQVCREGTFPPSQFYGFQTIEMDWGHPQGTTLWARLGNGIVDDKATEIFEFIDAAVNDKPFAPTFYDGMKVMELVDAIMLSTKENRWVKL